MTISKESSYNPEKRIQGRENLSYDEEMAERAGCISTFNQLKLDFLSFKNGFLQSCISFFYDYYIIYIF